MGTVNRLCLLLVVLLAACQREDQGAAPATAAVEQSAVDCAQIASQTFTNTHIETAEVVPAGAFTPPHPDPFGAPPDFSGLPAFCRIAGSLKPTSDSDIRFELWLPETGWNGKFMQTGNGGAAGSIVYGTLVMPLSRGYAVAHTDTGHTGRGGEFTWVPGHPEKLIDYQYRAVRELTVAGKAITETRYGQAPDKSYWLGCSTGGRQGLKEAQRYPQDYDAIIAGAPANNWSPLMSLGVVVEHNLGSGGLDVAKLAVLKEAALAACDAGDGVTDRVITSPQTCGFDPVVTQCADGQSEQCLTPAEVAAARRIYAGVINSAGENLLPGTGPGSELEWAGYASPGFRIGSSYYQHVIKNDPGWQTADFDVDADLALAEAFDGGAAKAMDPDLSAFAANGGKLIIYHGTTDGLIPYQNSVNYYNSVVSTLGKDAVADHVKLYLVPGMNHCAGGEGAFQVDWLTAMEHWVEDGRTPNALRAAHPADPATGEGGFTRPVCAYPGVAGYAGQGDNSDGANFECVDS